MSADFPRLWDVAHRRPVFSRRVCLVCPFFRPAMGRRVWENFARQTAPCELVIVENGPAVGFFEGAGLPGVTVLRSETGVGRARQAGLEYVRAIDGEFLMLDDDDFYGADYVREWLEYRFAYPEATVIGKCAHYVKLPEGVFYFAGWPSRGIVPAFHHGATIGVRAREAVDFPDSNATNDADWLDLMRARGAVFCCTGEKGYVYDRSLGSNTSPHLGHVPGTRARTLIKSSMRDAGIE